MHFVTEKYKHFAGTVLLQNSGNPVIEWFSEERKNLIDEIINNGKDFSDEKWIQLIRTKDDIILQAVFNCPNVPEHILINAIKISDIPAIKIELLKKEQSPAIIDAIVENSSDTYSYGAKLSYDRKTEENEYAQSNVNYVAKKILEDPTFYSHPAPLMYCTDEKLLSDYVQSPNLTFDRLHDIINNRYISDKLRDKIFDAVGFNYDDMLCDQNRIQVFTPHMAETLYLSAMESIDMALEGKCDAGVIDESVHMINTLYHADAMTDDMIIDYISRKATMSETNKKTDYVIEEIVRNTENPNVLAAIANLKNKNRLDIYYNPHTDKKLLTEEYNRILKKIKRMVLSSSTSITKPEKTRFLRLIQAVDLPLKDYEAMIEGLKYEKSGIIHYILERKQVDKEVLEAIKKERLYERRMPKHTQRHNVVAGMRLKYYDITNDDFVEKMLNATKVLMLYESVDKLNFHNHPALKTFIEEYPAEAKQWIKDFESLCKELDLEDDDKIISDAKLMYEMQIERIDKDSTIDVKNNTTAYLLEQYQELMREIKTNYSIYDLYRKIDSWTERYCELKEELDLRVKNIEKEVGER